MPSVTLDLTINRSAQVVFDYVTTPSNWPNWHVASLEVKGPTDRPLELGDKVIEKYRFLPFIHRLIEWEVTEKNSPSHWKINGKHVNSAGNVTIRYTLLESGEKTEFHRDLTYPVDGFFRKIVDFLYLNRKLYRESKKSLDNLKSILESTFE